MPQDIHEQFRQSHQKLRQQADDIGRRLASGQDIAPTFLAFQKDTLTHLRTKDLYYQTVDLNKRVEDRVLMHDLRNDHAAIVFTLESLGIRLKKNGANAEWQQKWKSLVDVLGPHFEQEEKQLFPLGKKHLSAEECAKLAESSTK